MPSFFFELVVQKDLHTPCKQLIHSDGCKIVVNTFGQPNLGHLAYFGQNLE